MRIIDLLQEASIDLHGPAGDKQTALAHLAALMAKGGNLADTDAYLQAVLASETEGSTGIGEGIAIPHAKTAAVKTPGLAAMIVKEGVEFDSLDGAPAHLFFLIAAPQGGNDVHLELLSRLSRLLMDDDFRTALLAAATPAAFKAVIDAAETKQLAADAAAEAEEKAQAAAEKTSAASTAATASTVATTTAAPAAAKPFVVAVTACPTGIAHTYMAAEALEQKAGEMGIDIKVETNGSGGVKHQLTEADIRRAAGVIVAADKNVPTKRFAGKQVLFVKVAAGIKEPERLINEILTGQVPVFNDDGAPSEATATTETSAKETLGRQIYKHLMNGVSHMLPFVIGGGIMIALAFLFDMQNAGAANFGSGSPLAAFLKNIGGLSFGMMMPVLAGYIAYSIGDRPALMPGFVGGLLATAGGSGFFGALFAGFIAGYLILALGKAFKNLPASLEGTKPVLLYPVLGLALIGIIMTFIINPPTAVFNKWLAATLGGMSTGSRIALGLILGGMMSIDFGGPINKAAYVFGTASLAGASGQAVSSGIMASVMIGGMVPPICIALATRIFKNKFTAKERQSWLTTIIMGFAFITEGAIPYAAADPLHVIPSCAIGAAVAGGLSMLFNCALPAPHGGIFVFGVVTNWPMYLAALLIGAAVGAVLLGLLKKPAEE